MLQVLALTDAELAALMKAAAWLKRGVAIEVRREMDRREEWLDRTGKTWEQTVKERRARK